MNHSRTNECQYKVDLPYPPVYVDGPNPVYACEILSNVGGAVSEMSDVSLYFYNSVVLEPQYRSIAECFQQISIIEMYHLNIFAELSLQLGADPRLWSGRTHKHWWTPAYKQYPREIRALIGNSIEGEKTAILKYSWQASTICDRNITAILNRIILDEEHHLQTFEEMYHQL